MQNYPRFFAKSFAVNFRAAAEYRGNFLLQVFGMVLNNAAFLVFWNIFLERTGRIGGYGFEEVLFLWGMASAAFGLGHVLFGNVRMLSRAVVQGELDSYLLQPKDPFLNFLVSRTQLSAWGDLLFGLGVFVYLSLDDPLRILFYLAFCASGAVLFVSIFAMVESLSFFWGNSSALSRTFLELMLTSTLYPETIFGPGLRWIFYTVLPAGFISFVPLEASKFLRAELLLVIFLVAAAYAAGAYALFRLGLKRYESGNLMGERT